MRAALRRSGYLIEQRLYEELEVERGYIVVPNAVYRDPNTGRARELDLLASVASVKGDPAALVSATLLIECVNNPAPVALLRAQPFQDMRLGETVRCVGVPANVELSGQFLGTPLHLNVSSFHHYASDPDASQFCSFERKKADGTWMATHPDDQFDSFVKLTDALEDRITRDVMDDPWQDVDHVSLRLYYPILVVQGKLVRVEAPTYQVEMTATSRMLYRRWALVAGVPVQYHIDVVTERGLPKLLDQIQLEIETLCAAAAADGVVATTLARSRPQLKAAITEEERRRLFIAGRDLFGRPLVVHAP